jgi:hypothetical protein
LITNAPPCGVTLMSGFGAPGVGVSKKAMVEDPFGLRP